VELLILYLLVVLTICVFSVWFTVDRPPVAGATGTGSESGPQQVAAPESLEGVLVAQLVGGEITSRQYQQAMVQLAARDDDRHPLSVPPDTGSASA
jgi:hypothetical protein